jgi:hypothetical protein
MKIALLYSELRELLAPVIPHAGTDDMLPVLCTIPIATSGEHLVAQATDRFTAAFKRVKPATRPPARFAVLLQAADAKRLLNLLRPSRGTDPEITVEVTKSGEILVSSKSPGFALGFIGLIMPRRHRGPGAAEVVEDWRGTIPVDGVRSPKAKPAKTASEKKAAREAAGIEYEPAGASS